MSVAIPGNFLSSTTEAIDPNTSGWVAKLNCAIALGTGGRNGDGALKLTSSAAGEMQARTVSSYAVAAGVVYQAFCDGSGATVPDRIGIRWLNAASAEISISWSLTTATASATWHRIAVGAAAPSGAVWAQVVVSAVTPAGSGVIGYFENVYFGFPLTTTGNLLGYNTETLDVDGSTWAVGSNCALTRQAPMVQWPVNYYLGGGPVLALTVTANGNASTLTTERPTATPGVEYIAYAYLNPPTSGSTTWVELRYYDGSGTQLQATRSTLAAPGTGYYRQIASAVAPAGTATCAIAAGIDSGTAAQVMRVDGIAIIMAPALRAGSVVPYTDASFEEGVGGWTVVSGTATIARSTPWGAYGFVGSYVLTLTSATATTSVLRSPKYPLGLTTDGSQIFKAEMAAQVTAGGFTLTRTIRFYDAGNVDVGTVTSGAATAPTPGWWLLSIYDPAPAGATQAAVEYTLTATSTSSVFRIDRVALWQSLPDLEMAGHDTTASITITVRELSISETITVYRVTPDGTRTLVRGPDGLIDHMVITSDVLVFEDYEAPLGIPVGYLVQLWDAATGASAGTRDATTDTTTLAVGDPNYCWLKDPGQPQRNLKVMVDRPPDWARPIPQGVYRPVGRRNAVILSGTRGGLEGDLQIFTLSDAEREALHYLLDPGHVLLWQAAPGYGISDMYVSVGDAPEKRSAGAATETIRLWTLSLTQVDMPTTIGVAGSAGRTWQDVLSQFATWQAVLDAYATWEDLLFDRRIGS